MQKHLVARIEKLLGRNGNATLATCGAAGPQISPVTYQMRRLDMYLIIPQASDHLFNLGAQPALALLTPNWKLYGLGTVSRGGPVTPLRLWQTVVHVEITRLHILAIDGTSSTETIDF